MVNCESIKTIVDDDDSGIYGCGYKNAPAPSPPKASPRTSKPQSSQEGMSDEDVVQALSKKLCLLRLLRWWW